MLTPKQALFVKEYLVDLNATQAAIRAGYSFLEKPIKGYYVYFLVNPINGLIFYVGKGTKKRLESHVRNANLGKIDNAGKFKAINSILKAGKKPLELIFYCTNSEAAAYCIEYQLISDFRELGLENISGGVKNNSRLDIEKSKSMLSRMKTFSEWERTARDDVRTWAVKNYGSMERSYVMFRVEILNNIIHLERNLNA